MGFNCSLLHHNRILNQLGSGQFGEVCKAAWSISGATKELAVKTLRPELPEEEKVRFLQEAAIMGQFSHPNVVKLYGVITVGDPVSYAKLGLVDVYKQPMIFTSIIR